MPVDVSVLTDCEATTAIDAFNRADEDPLSDGGNWTTEVAAPEFALKVVSNECKPSVLANSCASYRNPAGETWNQNMVAIITIKTKAGGTDEGSIGIYIELQGAGLGSGTPNGYLGELRTRALTDEFRIHRIDAGAPTPISSGTLQETSAGDKLGVVRNNNDIELWWKTGSTWTYMVSVTDANYTGTGKAGLSLNDSGGVGSLAVDDFKVMNWSAAAATDSYYPGTVIFRPRLRVY